MTFIRLAGPCIYALSTIVAVGSASVGCGGDDDESPVISTDGGVEAADAEVDATMVEDSGFDAGEDEEVDAGPTIDPDAIPTLPFTMFYDVDDFETINRVHPVGDGLIFAGTSSGDRSGRDFAFMKVGFDGVIQWQRHFGGNGWDEATAIAETDDGFIFAGRMQTDSMALDGGGVVDVTGRAVLCGDGLEVPGSETAHGVAP